MSQTKAQLLNPLGELSSSDVTVNSVSIGKVQTLCR